MPHTDDKAGPSPIATPQLPASSSPSPPASDTEATTTKPDRTRRGRRLPPWLRLLWDVVRWTPPRCRWDPAHPPKFNLALNLLFAVAGAFTVANLYYSHPILNVLAHDFGVEYEKVAQIPTAQQAGYAAGLLFVCPLGDLLRRRPFVLSLVCFTAVMWIGLCVTNNLAAFTAISCIVSITTVTPQLMLPLVGDLAPPHRRASAMSIVVSGFMLGILVARVLSGTLTNFTSWRAIYWFAFGMQTLILALLWLFMPDYPSANPAGLNYFRMLYSILQMLVRHAVLVQACLVSFFTSCTFTSFWTTLTFLLAGAPYHYSSLVIGLFALIGIAAMLCAPLYARLVIDRFVPLFSVIVCESVILLGICLGTYLGSFTVAGPILQAFLLDFGLQGAQTANRSNIYSVEPRGRNRVNTAFMVATFGGQLTGTAVGNHVYARAGWIGSGSASVGFIGAGLLCCAARGPWETRWVGWRGGWSIIKKDKKTADGKVVVAAGEKQDENWKGEERKDEELPPPPSPPAYDEKAVVEETNAREVDARDGSEKAVDAGLRSAEDSRLQSTESLEIKTAEKSQEELDDGKRGRA